MEQVQILQNLSFKSSWNWVIGGFEFEQFILGLVNCINGWSYVELYQSWIFHKELQF